MLSRLTIALTVLLAVVPAWAEDRGKAERYFRLGEKAYQAQNFEAAAQDFEEAYKNFPIPEIAFSAAQAYRRQYRIDPRPEYVALAVKHYRVYLGKVRSGGRVADAADALSEMQTELERLIKSGKQVSEELARDYTRLVVNASLGKETGGGTMQEVADKQTDEVVKIDVRLDGTFIAPFAPVNVAPGKHKVRVVADGYFAEERVENVAPGETTISDFSLRPRPARVTVTTEPGARILVDGRPQASSAFDLDAGRHVVSVLHRGRVGVAREVSVKRGQQLTLDQPLEHTTRRALVPWIIAASGAAFVFSGLSVGLAIYEDHRAADILDHDIGTTGNQPSSTLARYDRARTWRDRYAIAGWTSGGACVALAGVAALLYYTDNPSPDGVRVEPLATDSSVGATIAGRF